MSITLAEVVAILALALTILNMVTRNFGQTTAMKERIRTLEATSDPKFGERLKVVEAQFDPKLMSRVEILEDKMRIFWTAIERNLVDLLKQPIHLEMDALLDKVKHTGSESLSDGELEELKCRMLVALDEARVSEDPKIRARSTGYVLLIARVEGIMAERGCSCNERNLTHVPSP